MPVAFGQQADAVAIDVEEWRDQPVRHFYIHGVLNGDTAFQVRLPERTAWKGRLFQFLEGSMGGHEKTGESIGDHAYALANGAVYVESSQGHRGSAIYRESDTLAKIAYEASYAVLRYAKSRCVELYGKEPAHGYVYGQSGGGMRASGLLERFPKDYQGAVGFEGVGQMKTLALLYSVYEKYRRSVRSRDPDRPDAALQVILKAGFPARRMSRLGPSIVSGLVIDLLRWKIDPDYFQEFWQGSPGNPAPEAPPPIDGEVKTVMVRQTAISAALPDPAADLSCFTLTFLNGAEAGQWRRVMVSQAGLLALDPAGPGLDRVKPGDKFRLDDRDLVAFREYHRFIMDAGDRSIPGIEPSKPPRPRRVLDLLEGAGYPTGKLQGKMITVFSVDDQFAWPAMALRYKDQVEHALGQRTADHFRLHLVERVPHTFTFNPASEVGWFSLERKTLDDLMAWVEDGVAPAPGTAYTISPLNQIVLPEVAADRRGCQPVIRLAANGARTAVRVRAGEPVTFQADAADPDNQLAQCEIDFEGDGKFDESRAVSGRAAGLQFSHTYAAAGTYTAVARITDATSSKGSSAPGIQNLAHVRIQVE